MVFYGSDGWLPSNEEDFFSRRSVDVICSHLNLDATAPVLPDRPWRSWIAQSANEYRKSLNGVIQSHAQSLDSALIKMITEVMNSPLLGVFSTAERGLRP
jgi:hypothetical protein